MKAKAGFLLLAFLTAAIISGSGSKSLAHAAPTLCKNTYGGDVIFARAMKCEGARQIVRAWARAASEDGVVNRVVRGFRCKGKTDEAEGLVMRCVRGKRRVSFYANVPPRSVSASSVAGISARRVYFPSRCTNSKFRPRTIVVACGDAGFIIESISWARWDRKAARGWGTGVTKTCVPDCASGGIEKNPVAVRLRRVVLCKDNGHLQYTRLIYDFGASDPNPAFPDRIRFPC